MKALQKSIVVTLGSLFVMSVASCAAKPVPQDLLDARAAYVRAQAGPAAQYERDRVHEPKVALDKAEMSYLDDPADQKTKDLAYVARRRVELANADERAKDAMDRLAAAAGTVKQESRGLVITLSGGVLFASNKDALLPGAEERLGQVADALKSQDDHEIIVEGHTDSQGSAASNQGLSDRRARSVASFLVLRGVPADQIRAEGLGRTRPIADNGSAEGRASNRRVEIISRPASGH